MSGQTKRVSSIVDVTELTRRVPSIGNGQVRGGRETSLNNPDCVRFARPEIRETELQHFYRLEKAASIADRFGRLASAIKSPRDVRILVRLAIRGIDVDEIRENFDEIDARHRKYLSLLVFASAIPNLNFSTNMNFSFDPAGRGFATIVRSC